MAKKYKLKKIKYVVLGDECSKCGHKKEDKVVANGLYGYKDTIMTTARMLVK